MKKLNITGRIAGFQPINAAILLFCAAFGIRLLNLLLPVAELRAGGLGCADNLVYYSQAKAIAQSGFFDFDVFMGFPLKDHPVYPYFLGAVFLLNGSVAAIIIAQALVGAVVCILLYFIALEILGPSEAALAGVIALCYPVFVRMSGLILTENVFVLFFTACVLAFVEYQRHTKLSYLLLGGFFLAFATLSRSVSIFFLVFISLVTFAAAQKSLGLGKAAVHHGLLLMVFVSLIAPWTVRNYFVSQGSFIPVTEAADRGFYMSFCPYQGKIFGIRPDDDPVMVEARGIKSFEQRRSYLLSKTFESIRKDPLRALRIELLKIGYLWSPFDWEILGGGQAAYNWGFVSILPFFIYATIRIIAAGELAQHIVLFMPIIYFQMLHLVYFALPRFRVGFEPSFIILATYGMRSLYKTSDNKRIVIWCIFIWVVFNITLFFFSGEAKDVIKYLLGILRLW